MNSEFYSPQHRGDFERLNALIAAGPQAAEPLLEELLHWLQDMNYPIAAPLAEFLVSVGAPLIPHLRKILLSGDDMWIYWVLQSIVARLPPGLIRDLEPQIYQLACSAENDVVATRIAVSANLWDRKRLLGMIDNKLRAYKELTKELVALKDKLNVEIER